MTKWVKIAEKSCSLSDTPNWHDMAAATSPDPRLVQSNQDIGNSKQVSSMSSTSNTGTMIDVAPPTSSVCPGQINDPAASSSTQPERGPPEVSLSELVRKVEEQETSIFVNPVRPADS